MRMMVLGAAHAALYQLWLADQVPDAPDFPVAVDDSAATEANTPVTVAVLANDTHPAGELLTLVSATVAALQGTVVVNGDGTLTYSPALGFSGAATISYVVADEAGDEATGTLTVAVAVEPAPVANADTATTAEDTPITVNVLANDSHPAGDALTITAATVSPVQGTVTNNGDGTLTFTPAPNWNGEAVISYSVEDENGDMATSTLTVTVTPVDDVPVVVADTASTDAGIAVTVNVLANDSHPDGDSMTVISATVSALEGTAEVIGNQVRFTPASGFIGTAIVTYTVEDATGDEASATLTVTVNEVPGVDADLFNDAVAPYWTRQVNGSSASFSASGSAHWADKEGLGGAGTVTGTEWRVTTNVARALVRLQGFSLTMPNGLSRVRWRCKPVDCVLPKLYVSLGAYDMTTNFLATFDVTDDATEDAARVHSASSHISNAGITRHPVNGWWYLRFDVDMTGIADRAGTMNLHMLDAPGTDLLVTRTPFYLLRCENLTVQAL